MWRRTPGASRLEEPGHSWAKQQHGQIKTIQSIKSIFWSQEQNIMQNTGILELPKYPFIFLVRIWWKLAQRLFLWMDERSLAFQLFFSQEGSNSVNLLYILSSKHILNPCGILILLHRIFLCLNTPTNEYIHEVVIKDEDYRNYVKLCPLPGLSHSLNLSKYDKETF